MKQILNYLFNHQTLSKAEAKAIMIELAQGKFNETEATAFVTVYMMRPITLEELRGFREALLDLALTVDLGTTDLVDIVGTGGDGKDTFNISTLASFIVAGAGQKVAKHGNYGVSSISGASNVLETLGYRFKTNTEDLKSDLDRANICFLHAPLFHPALKAVAGLRKGLQLRTFFNLLGPLVNPARPQYSILGVYSLEVARLYQYLLQQEPQDFMLLHALDGYDEISLTQDTKVIDHRGEYIYSAEDLGFQTIPAEALSGGGSKEEAAAIFKTILEGKGTPEQNAVVLANAAMALYATHHFGNYQDCLQLAKDSLYQGKAYQCLQNLIKS
ncbi:anthranilate phosphoribosyltransferase [Riemerella columbina]|uniref:anthranilate phosphoribosyltransferase n=1 Tax=Riemerella columbina TaxID=103810 RepID=UPI002670586F|nr:anthranilate phosphoribosyltransferase [Riemerella columbina]WKS94488.1 anthranilate phosphoribosyltransferase [Riemerella columbina]